MEESFSLPVTYKGDEKEIQITLRVTGYSPRFIALVEGIEVTIEKDEEGQYRAINYITDNKDLDKELLAIIVMKIREVFS